MKPTFDDRDQAILRRREDALKEQQGHRVGDYVEFADGVVRRISRVYLDGHAQTSDPGASFYLGDFGVSMSGSLYPAVPPDSLSDTGRTRPGAVWFFHHDEPRAHNGVDVEIAFRVYACSEAAPR